MKRKPITELEQVAMRDAIVNYEESERQRARAEAAEAEAEQLRDARDDAEAETARTEDLLGLAQHERDEARAEVARLREELAVTQDLLRDAPIPFQDDVHQPWYDAVTDYLETLNSGQDAVGG